MRVTLDTNVLVSAFIARRGQPAEILDLITTLDEISLVLSEEILAEFTEVMSRDEVRGRLGYTKEDVDKFEQAVRDVAEMVKIESDLRVVKEDPEDDFIVNTALDGRADYIVSGDEHLQRLGKFREVHILSPRGFLAVLSRQFGDLILPKNETE